MLEYAQAQFALAAPADDTSGKSKRELFEEIARQTGIVAPELQNIPLLPFETAHIWRWFNEIGRARTAGWSIDPISWEAIHAYFDLHRMRPAAWELQALRYVDDEFLASRLRPTKRKVTGAADLRKHLTGPDKLKKE